MDFCSYPPARLTQSRSVAAGAFYYPQISQIARIIFRHKNTKKLKIYCGFRGGNLIRNSEVKKGREWNALGPVI
jgi:hypothetical protein